MKPGFLTLLPGWSRVITGPTFARWRSPGDERLRWLPPASTLNTDPDGYLPRLYDSAVAADHFAIFADFMDMGIYDKPVFGDCVWVARAADASLAMPLEGWLPTAMREAYGRRGDLADRLAYVLPQPARLNGEPVAFLLHVQGDVVIWPESISWQSESAPIDGEDRGRVVGEWPGDFADAYRADVLSLSAETGEIFTPLECSIPSRRTLLI